MSQTNITKSEIRNWPDIVELLSANRDYSEYFSNTVKNLLLNDASCKRKSFVVTSPAAGEGKTTVAVNIAAVLASRGMKTILIDANLTGPGLEELFNISDPTGLTDVISGTMKIEETVIQILDYPYLHLLTSGTSETGDLSLSSDVLKDMITSLRGDYDYIIIDTASIEESFDPILLAGAVDATILVAHCDHTSKASLKRARKMIKRNNGEIAGVILNKTPCYVPTYYRSA